MRRASAQDGFTLIEVLIGMVLTVVVFGATLTVLDAFSHQYQGGQRRLDAQNTARVGVDRIVRQLRNIASPVTTPKLLERATPYDVVFQTVGPVSGSNSTGTERVRYCLGRDSSGNGALYSETQTWTTSAPASDPWSSDPSVTIPCPDSPLPAGVNPPATIVAGSLTNVTGGHNQCVFEFNNSCTAPSDLGQIYTVQIDLFVNPTPTFARAETEIKTAAFLRNQPREPIAHFQHSGIDGGSPSGVLLDAGASYSPDGEDLSYSWDCSGGCPDEGSLTSAGTGLVVWRPGRGTYTVTLTVTDQTGLQGFYQDSVTCSDTSCS